MESLGGNLRHKLWVEILTVSLVPWFSPCLTCTFHRGCLCIAYRISPRDCCFVTFCTIVLAGFVLHAVLKKNFHTILCLFFSKYVYSFPYKVQSSAAPRELLHVNTDCPLQPSVMCLAHGVTCAAALVNGHNKRRFTEKEQL